MPKTTVDVRTPNYTLIAEATRIGPKILPFDTGLDCSAIYGFSDKGPYDKFCANSQRSLKPYPLVKGYLRNQIDDTPDRLKLVVIDAASSNEPNVYGATIEAVLEAQERRASHVTAEYRLTFDEQANAYRVCQETSEAAGKL